MKYLFRYLTNIGSIFSISINTLIFLGAPSEALSERCGRHEFYKTNMFFGFYLRKLINIIFFYDSADIDGNEIGHCMKAFMYETTGEVLR